MENTFCGQDNKTYVLHPLTLGDNKKFVRWAKYRNWESFQGMKEILPSDTFSKESNRILEECSGRDWNESTKEVKELEKTLEGVAYWVYLSLKHTYPQITLETVEEVITPNNLFDVYKRLMILSGLIAKKNEKEKEPEPEKENQSPSITGHSTERESNAV